MNASYFARRIYLITGAAGGLGSALARALSAHGAELILLDRSQRGLNALHDELERGTGRQPGLYPLDLAGASEQDYADLCATVKREYGALHGLIHCAADLGQLTPFEHFDPGAWQQTYAANLLGPALLTRSLLALLRSSRGASIIFTLDHRPQAYWGAYGSSKSALAELTCILADELDGDRATGGLPLTCNGIYPGPMRSALRSSAYPGEDPAANPAPASRCGAYLHLLGDKARNINGQMLTVQPDGSYNIRPQAAG